MTHTHTHRDYKAISKSETSELKLQDKLPKIILKDSLAWTFLIMWFEEFWGFDPRIE